jgi:hypothetical protein
MKSGRTIRALQFYAVLCLCRYCGSRNVISTAVDELVTHLVSFLTVPSITDWEQDGTRLLLTGRGDEVPDDVRRQIPAGEQALFFDLVECAVDVGNHDMYSALTDGPYRSLMHCLRMVGECGLSTADIEPQLSGSPEVVDWGAAMSMEDRALLVSQYPEVQRYVIPAA